MAEINIKIGATDYKANLNIEALERIEATFDNMGLGQILEQKRGLRTGKAIVLACVIASNPGVKPAKVEEQLNKLVEDEGVQALWEPILELVEASGLMGKSKAKEAAAKN